ncbi:MAG: FHA domain-containing protein [Clostridia bacterium]
MSTELYQIVSLAARYVFCGLIVGIVLRAWRMTVTDNRRARLLRAWSPETGCIGQFLLNPKRGRSKVPAVPIPREGVLGSARSADISIRSRALKREHFSFEQREGGLLIKPCGRAAVVMNDAIVADTLFMRDGDTLIIGDLKLLLVLFDPDDLPKDERPLDDSLWDAPPARARTAPDERPLDDSLWDAPPTRGNAAPDARDDLRGFEDELWPDD